MSSSARRASIRASVAALVALAGATANAAPPAIVAVEQAVETSAGQLALPGGGVGAMNLQPCARCRPVSLLAVSSTRWIAGGQALPFAEFSRLAALRPAAPVVVLYRKGSGEITRVIAQLPPGVAR
jgi:hypothetical protein